MKMTVLGKYSPYPPAGGAGPGYWVEAGESGTSGSTGSTDGILLDCGPGVLSRFQEHVGAPIEDTYRDPFAPAF